MSKQYPLIANAWINNTRAPRNARMFASDNTLYSYGHHYTIARKLDDTTKTALFNLNDNSATTNKQRHATKRALTSHNYKILFVPAPSESLTYNLHKLSNDVDKTYNTALLNPIKQNMLELKTVFQAYNQLACYISGGLDLHPDYEKIADLFDAYRRKPNASKEV